ncbi:DUF2262 domain-containing protein [Microbacterium sp. SORGH_AS_0969]|uniref:DUF2262 domain-containing protein n=1 Tax=Microbacterium sp. SORGH_AS_0969 TaxID=3041793 RepID=UPI002780ACD1|nr:DUF2262 domain-containing protein [Microbacterium sp. SORGH_AS_0969]MDQ1075407.1 hypothetical protein [Microbacterium sp. SORGH_AS_0969]
MPAQQERAEFDRRHAPEPIEIVVLTGQSVGGAGKAGGAELWTPSADVLAYVDGSGAVVTEEGRLSWLATDAERDGWIHDLEALTQYRVRVRRATPDSAEYAKYNLPVPDLSHHFALDEVIERDLRIPALDGRRDRWLRPIVLSTELGEFTLDRSYGWFSGGIEWAGEQISVTLSIDDDAAEGAETCEGSLARLRALLAEMPDVDARWRAFAAEELTDLANDWQEEDEDDDAPAPEPITRETFAERIRLSELSIAADGSATAYFDDGDLFFGHVILIDVQSDNRLANASIAG